MAGQRPTAGARRRTGGGGTVHQERGRREEEKNREHLQICIRGLLADRPAAHRQHHHRRHHRRSPAAAGFRGGCRLGETLTATLHPFYARAFGPAGSSRPWRSIPGRPAHRRKTTAHRPHSSYVSRSPSDPPQLSKSPEKTPEL
jgi:hypothetical protein